ncbi:MAG: Hsp20/alpha crystallin family protein [Patescibacteria group bacterium]|nr:Hsp20/alpha crystallin family protein [Patescibacteria group bacterium]
MDNNKEFFEQLAGVKAENDEVEAELVRASKVAAVAEGEEAVVTTKNGFADVGFDDAEGHLLIDVYHNAETITIESAIAGVESDDLDISITPESVVIKGTRNRKEKVHKNDYLHQECFWGKFSRSVILPQEIDPDKAQASLKDGVLKIVLPKIHRGQGKKIRVKLD